jgi:sec-independent protein translocase protein TatC
VAAFFFKEPMFNIIFGPLNSDFILYQGFNKLLGLVGLKGVDNFDIKVMNIEMSAQFFTHLKVSFFVALIIGMPFFFYQLWTFIRPALYPKEKKAIRGTFGFAGMLFYLGLACGYFLVLPLTVKFLGTYQVSPDIPNEISLTSYIGMFLGLILVMGIVFEMPILAALLSRIGLISKETLKKYRRHAIVILVILAAIITPSGDAFTMMIVAIPLYCLYEVSIMVARSEKYQNKESDDDDEAEYEEMDEDESDVDDHSLTEAGEAGK